MYPIWVTDDMSSVGTTLLAVSLLMDLEGRGKNERVGRVKRKRMVGHSTTNRPTHDTLIFKKNLKLGV